MNGKHWAMGILMTFSFHHCGCAPIGQADGSDYVFDRQSSLVGTWVFSSGTENGVPVPTTATERILIINESGGFVVVVDPQRATIQSGQWGVNGDKVQFIQTVSQGDLALWRGDGPFEATWAVQDNVLSLQGADGAGNRLILLYARHESS